MIAPLREALAQRVFGGLRSAAGVDALIRSAMALERASETTPRAGVLAKAIRQGLSLPPAEAAPRFLKLLVAVEQLGSDATPPPPLEAGPRLPPAHTPNAQSSLSPLDIAELRAAFSRRTAPSRAVLALLADPATSEDRRMWPLIEDGLSHPFLRELCADALIRLGTSWVPRLATAFNRDGGRTDAARLRALCGIMGPRALPLMQTSARRGSQAVRREAFEGLLRLSIPEATRALCEQFDVEPTRRPELLDLLAATGEEPALRRLLQVLRDEESLPPESFARLPDEAMSRWLSLACREAESLTTSATFFELMESHAAPAARDFLRARCEHPEPPVRRRAASALLARITPEDCALLIARGQTDPALEAIGTTACFALGPNAAFDALGPRLAALSPDTLSKPTREERAPSDAISAVLGLPPTLPTWLSVALQLLTPESDPRWRLALQALSVSNHHEILRALRRLDDAAEQAPTGTGLE